MSIPFTLSKAIRRHCLGGRVLLTLEYDLPLGSSHAATHFHAMVLALLRFFEATYLPIAADDLQKAVDDQAVHRFFPYRYRVNVTQTVEKGFLRLQLTSTLQRGSELLLQHSLDTLWEPTLSMQFPLPAKKF